MSRWSRFSRKVRRSLARRHAIRRMRRVVPIADHQGGREEPMSTGLADHIVGCLEALWKTRLVDETDAILVTAVVYPRSGNRTNLVQTHRVADLREGLGW